MNAPSNGSPDPGGKTRQHRMVVYPSAREHVAEGCERDAIVPLAQE